jgi:hypothetical protein
MLGDHFEDLKGALDRLYASTPVLIRFVFAGPRHHAHTFRRATGSMITRLAIPLCRM